MGVRNVLDVKAQLEVFGLGKETIESMGLEYVQSDSAITDSLKSSNQIWPARYSDDVSFLYGNPRCTGFSCLTGGCDADAHGAWSKQTLDIHQLMRYGIANDIPVICWESVQQAYTTGKPMCDYLTETLCRPNGYRVAHLFINASTFGNPQNRKRYFYLAYKADKNFNIKPPQFVPKRHITVEDVICTDEFAQYKPVGGYPQSKRAIYTPDSYMLRTTADTRVIPLLSWGWDTNRLCRVYDPDLEFLPDKVRETWETRVSDMPFSLHAICRLTPHRAMPVISGSSARYIHPYEDRGITVRECARLMGWPSDIVPVGPTPYYQIGKGIVPAVGEWLAEQVVAYLDDEWGSEDWESSYDNKEGRWVGRHFENDPIKPVEKVFDLTKYAPEIPPKEALHESFEKCNEAMGGRYRRLP